MKRREIIEVDIDFKEIAKLLNINGKFEWASSIQDLDGIQKGVSIRYIKA